ncbi:putative MORN repeat-containing protein [Tokyovirus A1]|uniref:putative MORN repeat-containing protein n=1 Tax=Tokyovirus A1 TaxID=1826170 RepID=UPI0007A98995|nr:putative MORN repeat-containing protein [Tokyovirus A1]BAU80035.1 putative MORN repeat-containing protein [Tokyovirus A1]
MASLKLLSALKVSTCSGIAELDEYVSSVRLFVSGDSQNVPEGFSDYQEFAVIALGHKFYANGENTFFLNKNNLLEGPCDIWDRERLEKRTWFLNGEKHGLETTWWCPKTKRTEVRLKEGKKVGEHKKWYRTGWLSEVELYSEEGVFKGYTVYSLETKDKIVFSADAKQLE